MFANVSGKENFIKNCRTNERIKNNINPIIPPIILKNTDSIINCRRMNLLLAPNAFCIPIC